MTRKEIEKRCLEEMQQTIPDTEALWERIEAQLPQQEVKEIKQSRTSNLKIIATLTSVAACITIMFSIGAYGSVIVRRFFENTQNKTASLFADSHKTDTTIKEEAENWESLEQEACEEKTEEGSVSYDSLLFPQIQGTNAVIDYDKLVKGDNSFDESEILQKTDCFVIAVMNRGEQDSETGEMIYELTVEHTFGADAPIDEILHLRSRSAYVLQARHTYVLPLYRDESGWKLSSESILQIEMTLDGRIVFYDGWKSMATKNSETLEYPLYDEFREHMRIADDAALDVLFEVWRTETGS